MACILSNSGIATGQIIRAAQVSQSVDAFTKGNAYDITLSGSLVITGSVAFSSSEAFDFNIKGLSCISQTHILNYNCDNGAVSFTEASSVIQQPSVSPYYTASATGKEILPLGGNNIMGCNPFSVIAGGCINKICSAPNAIYVYANVIGGGNRNEIDGSDFSTLNTIGGGNGNKMVGACISTNFIGGGNFNSILQNPEDGSDDRVMCSNFIGSGYKNIISGSNKFSIIIGGTQNEIYNVKCSNSGEGNIINGGSYNGIKQEGQLVNLKNNFIGGGNFNSITSCYHTETSPTSAGTVNNNFIGAGVFNTGSCQNGFIAAGCRNHLIHNNAFILGSEITSVAECTVHVNNLNVGCTTQMQLRTALGGGQVGMLIACDAGAGAAELYFHDGSSYKKVCLVP